MSFRLKKLFMLLFGLTVILASRLNAQTFDFNLRKESKSITLDQFQNSILMPVRLTVEHAVWTDMLQNPSGWQNDFKLISVHNFVKFKVNHAFTTPSQQYTYRMLVDVHGYNDPANPSNYTSHIGDTLTVTYDPDSLQPYQDKYFKKYSGYPKMEVYIQEIWLVSGSNLIPLSFGQNAAPGLNCEIEGEIWAPTYATQSGTITVNKSTSLVGSEGKLNVYWTNSSFSTPAQYELQWTYVDDYKKTDFTSTAISSYSASELDYSFKNNSSSILTNELSFNIPLIYNRGYLVYRVRQIRPDPQNFVERVYSDWTLPESGVVGSLSGSHYYYINSAHMNDALNWQYTISFAEEGKYKQSLNYFDGALKPRQSLTKLNTNNDKVIVTENIYDYEGRPSITLLPTPVAQSKLAYVPNMAINATTNDPYKPSDFDLVPTSTCPEEVPVAPLSSSALASQYYSPSNPEAGTGFHKFIPDAKGFPFVRSIIAPENPGRVLRQGGAGDKRQIGTGNETVYSYVSAEQSEIDRLFGTEIGRSEFYRKTVVSDPNGQTTFSITDNKGRIRATGLIGDGPDANTKPVDPIITPQAVKINQDILAGIGQNFTPYQWSVNRSFYVHAEEGGSTYDLQYQVSYPPYNTGCPDKYLTVASSYNYELFDQCGVFKTSASETIGTTGVIASSADVSNSGSLVSLNLNRGVHTVNKFMSINLNDVSAAVDSFMKDTDDCYKNEDWFIRKAVEGTVFPCPIDTTNPCDAFKKTMIAQMYAGAKYGKYDKTITGEIIGTDTSIFKREILPDETVVYLYQKCQDVADRMPDSVFKDGQYYYNLTSLPVETFMWLLNYNEKIAEALLPLHPEYCKLLSCSADSYSEFLSSIPNYKDARELGYFLLDDIVSKDPLAGQIDPDSLKHIKNRLKRLDSLSIAIAYCAGIDTGQFNTCYNEIYHSDIMTGDITAANPVIQENYFNTLVDMYLGNRERIKQELRDDANNTCAPCQQYRLMLIPQPVFPSAQSNTAGVTDSAHLRDLFAGADNDTEIPDWVFGALTNDTINSWTVDSARAIHEGESTALCDSVVNQWMKILGNCSIVQSEIDELRDSIRNYYCYGTGYGKPMTIDVMRGILVAKGFSIDALCNPYLVDYNILPNATVGQERYACKNGQFYYDAVSFFNRTAVKGSINNLNTQVIAGLNTTGNTFEALLASSLNATSSNSIDVTATYSAASKRYVVTVVNTANSEQTSIWLQKRDVEGACGVDLGSLTDWYFASVNCLLDQDIDVTNALINQFSFTASIVTVQGSDSSICSVLGWNTKVPFLDTVSSVECSDCIACVEMKQAYETFAAEADLLGVQAGHPFHDRILRNYLNEYFDRQLTENDYLKFIASCGISDSFVVSALAANYRLVHSSNTAADDFVSDFYDEFGFIPNHYRYKDGSSANIYMLLDLQTAPAERIRAINAFAESEVPSPNHTADFRWNSIYLGVIFVPDFAGFTPDISFGSPDISLGTAVVCSLYQGSNYVKGKYYPVEMAGGILPAYKIARNVNAVKDYLHTDLTAIAAGAHFSMNFADWVHPDYNNADKQAYLAYNYSIDDAQHNMVMRRLQSDSLMANIPLYSTKRATYEDPFILNDESSLFVATANQSSHPGYSFVTQLFADLKTYNSTTTGVGTIFNTNNNNPINLSGSRTVNVYRSGNGFTYWFRVFDAQDKLFDFWVNLPKYVTDPSQYVYMGLSVGSGDGEAYRAVINLQKNGNANLNTIGYGYSDFSVGNVVKFENSLLCNGMFDEIVYVDTLPCERPLLLAAISKGKYNYRAYLDSIRDHHVNSFLAHLKDNISESLLLSAIDQTHQFTLYYYDLAGNRTKTVPPAGVKRLNPSDLAVVKWARENDINNISTTLPAHSKVTSSKYNTVNQEVRRYTPDGGITDFYYDAAGRLAFSQNAKQRPHGQFTYILYDDQSRVRETGEAMFGKAGTVPGEISNVGKHDDFQKTSDFILKTTRYDVVSFNYDTAAINLSAHMGMSTQENLRGRRSTVRYFPTLYTGKAGDATMYYEFATHYSYDVSGNIKTVTHDFNRHSVGRQRFKRVDYDYDLLSGKVNMLSYNRGFPDQFYQRYSYDADNRITAAESSKDGVYWDMDANYKYYDHGPLARMGLGDLNVQGVDYAYTIQGWLKAMNGDILDANEDMGKDNVTTSYAQDVYASTLDYFADDYDPIGNQQVAHIADPTRGLYNGNIARQTTSLRPFPALNKSYRYDPLNRITQGHYFEIGTDNALNYTPEFRNRYEYDADGNIIKLIRMGNGSSPQLMDSMVYKYGTPTVNNRLDDVLDYANSPYTNDIQQYTTSGNVRLNYDAIGNLVQDGVNGNDDISWNVYNKVKQVRNASGALMSFGYNGTGDRVTKYSQTVSGDTTRHNTDIYIRDVSGNILAVFRHNQEFKEGKGIIDVIDAVFSALPIKWPYIGTVQEDPGFVNSLISVVKENSGLTDDLITGKDVSFYLGNNQQLMNLVLQHPETAHEYLPAMHSTNSLLVSHSLANYNPYALFDVLYEVNGSHSTNAISATLTNLSTNWPSAFAEIKQKLGATEEALGTTDDNAAIAYIVNLADQDKYLVATAFGGVMAVADSTDSVQKEQFFDAIVQDTDVFNLEEATDVWTPLVQDAMIAYTISTPGSDRNQIAAFYDDKPETIDYLRQEAGDDIVLSTVITNDFSGIGDNLVTTLGDEGIAAAIAGIPGQSVAKFLNKAQGLTASTIAVGAWLGDMMIREDFGLSEHHIYGSSRIGIKEYWPGQLGYHWEEGMPRRDIDSSGISQPQPWYSAKIANFVEAGVKEYAAAGDVDYTSWSSTRMLGQKKYELTDHLGNVQAVVLDRRTPVNNAINTMVENHNAEISAAWDYYPFGMYMPGRTVADLSSPCVSMSTTGSVTVRKPKDVHPWTGPVGEIIYGPLILGWSLIEPHSGTSTLSTSPALGGLYVTLVEGDQGMEYQLADMEAGVNYVINADIDLDEGEAEAELQVVHYTGAEEYEIVADAMITHTGAYNLNFTPAVGQDNLYVRLFTPNVMPVPGEGEEPHEATASVGIKLLELWETVQEPGEVFGTVCKGRDEYRFGYNGQEKDNEMKGVGNSINYEARFYDTRLGRPLTVDPLAGKYPDLSPYSFVNNNPITNKEIDGRYWLDFNVCDHTFKHSKKHGGSYLMVTNVKYGYTRVHALQSLNYASNIPFSPEISWTATAAKMVMAMKDNSIGFGATDWAGIMLNVVGAGIGKYADNAGKIVLDLNRSATGMTFEALQTFKKTDYYQLYLDGRASEILTDQGYLIEGSFSKDLLELWHQDGIKLLKNKDENFMKKYKVGKMFGTTQQGAPSEYVKDKVRETIDDARTQAANELDQTIEN